MFSKQRETFKFTSNQKTSNSDETPFIHPSDQPRNGEYPVVEGCEEVNAVMVYGLGCKSAQLF